MSRSENMARIRGGNTKPELLLRRALWRAGLRYRVSPKGVVGRPDIVFPRRRIAVFIDGCFWHGCPQHYVRPKTRPDFWIRKLKENTTRDSFQTSELERSGWRVVRVWEHVLDVALETVATEIYRIVQGGTPLLETPRMRVIDIRIEGDLDAETWTFADLHCRETKLVMGALGSRLTLGAS